MTTIKPAKPMWRMGLRPLAAVLALVSMIAGGDVRADTDTSALTLEQSEAVRDLIRETLLENPEIILEALQKLEARQKASELDSVQRVLVKQAEDLYRHPDDPVAGNPNGDVTVVEFFDYRCSYCKRVHLIVQQLLREDTGIRYVFKEFPILGEDSIYAAKAALASRPQGKYVAFSNALMESRGGLGKDKVISIAAGVGLDVALLEAEMQKSKAAINTILARNYQLAQSLKIDGTPGFVIGNELIRGVADLETLKGVVKQVRQRKQQ